MSHNITEWSALKSKIFKHHENTNEEKIHFTEGMREALIKEPASQKILFKYCGTELGFEFWQSGRKGNVKLNLKGYHEWSVVHA